MKTMCASLTASVLVLISAGTAHAAGLESAFLKPAAYSATQGQTVAVRWTTGNAVQAKEAAWPTEQIGWLFVRAAGSQENRENVGPRDASSDFIEFSAAKPGVALVGLDTKPRDQSWPVGELQDFLRRVLTPDGYKVFEAQSKEKAELKVRRYESAKTLVRVAAADGKPATPSSVAQSKTGQMVEIRAMTDPTLVPVGGDLPVKTYVEYDTIKQQKVLATCVATGKTREILCDQSGFATIRIDSTGEWRVEFHAYRKPREDENVDGVLYSATLTFEVTRTEGGK